MAEILRDLLAVTETDLHLRVYARFPGPQTPDIHLIRLCLFSYGDEHAPGHWRLRTEDDLEARAAETDAVIDDLSSLGRRLGFKVGLGIPRAGEWAVRWLDETGHATYAFAVRTTAVLGDLLFNPPTLESLPLTGGTGEAAKAKTTPCLTLPSGRAVLVGYKLRHDPRLRQGVGQHGWQFLKFRHLRHLVQEVTAKQLDRYAFQAALGCAHGIGDPEMVEERLRGEMENSGRSPKEPLADIISAAGRIARINLRPYADAGGSVQDLARAFTVTASDFNGSLTVLESFLETIIKMRQRGILPPAMNDIEDYFKGMKVKGYPPVHHTVRYRKEYSPAYRVISLDKAPWMESLIHS